VNAALDNPSLTENERILIRCRVASDFIHRGQYEAAREALGGLWPGIGQRPDVKKLPPVTAAEVLLQCGTLTGWLGSARNVSGAQEQANPTALEDESPALSAGLSSSTKQPGTP
jgi:hypothetical protein